MPTNKERIFPGDTLPIAIECRRNVPSNDGGLSEGLPDTPASAYVRILDRQTGTFLPIGGGSVTQLPATIIPAEGPEENDMGALIKYTVTSEFTQTPGDYTLLITAVYPDGAILTEDVIFKVLEYR